MKGRINNNINLNLSHSGTDQKLLTEVSGESEIKLINIFKELFELPVTKREAKKFAEAVVQEGWQHKKLEDWMRKIASDKLLKSLVWSINGIFHFSERLKDLNKIKTAVPAILEGQNEAYEELDISVFEGLIKDAFESVKNYILKFPKRTGFDWTLDDFKDYFKTDISHALQVFKENQSRIIAWKTEPQSSTDSVELMDEMPDLVVTSEMPKNLAAPAKNIPGNRVESSQNVKPELTPEIVSSRLGQCQREDCLDEHVQSIMNDYKLPLQISLFEEFKQYLEPEIRETAELKNREAQSSHRKFQEMRAEFLKLCKDSKKFPDQPLILPYPSYAKSCSANFTENLMEAV